MVTVVAASALGATACNNQASTTTPAAVAAAESTPAPAAATERAPGRRLFHQVEALDLRDEQRAAVSEIEQNLIADLTPHRETVRQVAAFLADGIAAGRIDASAAATQQAALAAAIAEARASFAGAMNQVHDTLDADQRAALVAKIEAQRLGHGPGAEGEQHGPLAKLALELGLSEEQKQNLHDALQKGVEQLFPSHKARREANEAKLKAMGQAFISDDFDAAELDLGGGSEHALESFGEIAKRVIDVSGSVLSVSQRQVLAEMIRSHAESI
jgi:Spy/CpxP family protein refolding chaperone